MGMYRSKSLTHIRIRTAFLEDLSKSIFIHTLRDLSVYGVLGMKMLKLIFQTEYFHLMNGQRQNVNQVKSKYKIVSFKDIHCINLLRFL